MSVYYVLYNTLYYDTLSETYNNILTVDDIPFGELANLVKSIKISQISRNKIINNNICTYAILNEKGCGYYTYNDMPLFITYLLNNNYKIYKDLDINTGSIASSCVSTGTGNKKPILFFYI
tara:strand:+ start:49 stop:411 length:363 start_codon:yes stop_codon:yes gene_type:complete